jgi:hypothetical protein
MGMAMVMMMMLVLLSMLLLGSLSNSGGRAASGSMTAGDNAIQLASTRAAVCDAFNLAQSGLTYTQVWLSSQAGPPANTKAFAPSLWGAVSSGTTPPRAVVSYPDSTHFFSVTIYPDVANTSNAQYAVQKGYLIESIGSSNGVTQVLHEYVQEGSFSQYALFIDNGNGGYWGSDTRNFDGPVHINGGPLQGINWRDSTLPVFTSSYPDAYTVSMASVPWMHNGSGSAAPQTLADWATVSAGGSSSVKWGVPAIPMPTVNYIQQYAALGLSIPDVCNSPPASSNIPSSNGVTVTSNGGIYVHGDVSQMVLSAAGTNNVNQVITVYQNDSSGNPIRSIVTLDPQSNVTHLQSGPETGSTGNYTINSQTDAVGTTNGVVYCDGNIGGQTGTLAGGLSGVVADNVVDGSGNITHYNGINIVTDPAKNLNIDGSITYNTPRQISTQLNGQSTYRASNGTLTNVATGNTPVYVKESLDTGGFKTHAGRMGIVSHTIEVLDKTYDPLGLLAPSSLNVIEVDAAVLATGTYELYNNGTRAQHNFLNMGSYIIGNGANVSSISRVYDDRLTNMPPPYYPTTGTTYKVLSWQRVGQTLE